MAGRARIAVHGTEDAFTVHLDAVVEHKHLGPARDHVGALKAALEDYGCQVEVFDELQATTHPHLVKTDDPEIEADEADGHEVAQQPLP